jgi:hypothetical protein
LYHLGKAFTTSETQNLKLTPEAARTWSAMTKQAVVKKLSLRVKIPGGNHQLSKW